MGKSNKKVKSDRINALRKQYDAFLEEDKKRKERNEYILGRLDKMRYSTALVPVRHKPSPLDTRSAVVNHLGYQPECPVRDFSSTIANQSQVFPDIQVKNNEDTCLIQEISKKYILIPKLRSSLMNNYLQNITINQNKERVQEMHPLQDTIPIKDLEPNINENTDWKSKYEILNILKNEEKETKSGTFHAGYEDESEINVNNESLLGNKQEPVSINYNNNINTDILAETAKNYVNELPEKDLPADTLHSEFKNNNEYIPKDIVHANFIPNTNTYNEDNEGLNTNDDQTDGIDYQLQNIQLECSDAPNIGLSAEVTKYETQPEYDVNMSSTHADISAKQSVDTNSNVNVESEYPVKFDSAINDPSVSVEQHKSADPEHVYFDEVGHSDGLVNEMNSPLVRDVRNHVTEAEHSIEASNVQEFTPNQDVQIKADFNVNPEGQNDIKTNVDPTQQTEQPVFEQTENPVDISESIDDFNAEHNEMFYSEHTKENYPNQQNDASANNLEYPQNEYQQNQEYAYYEGTQGEAYHDQINDQEVTQQYDPNYEQQYADLDQELEQQQYEQQPQQYQEPEASNLQHPELEPLQYEQPYESQEHIEQTLDVEDGYVDHSYPTQEAEGVEQQYGGEGVEQQYEGEGVEQQYEGEAVEKQHVVKAEAKTEKLGVEEIQTPENIMG